MDLLTLALARGTGGGIIRANPMPVLIVRLKGAEPSRVPVGHEAVLIGRLKPADVVIDDPLVSGAHARVYAVEGRLIVRDLKSRNGTYLNGARVSEGALKIGDRLQIGNAIIEIAAGGPVEALGGAGTERAAGAEGAPSGEVTTVRLELEQVREGGFDVARTDDERLSLVWSAGEALNRLSERRPILDAVRELLDRAFAPSRAFVLATEDGGVTFETAAGPTGPAAAPSHSVAGEAAATRSAILSKSMAEDQRFKTAESVVSARIETAIAAPLLCRDRTVAVIYVDRLGGRPFTERDVRLLGLIANHVASALENASLVAELRLANEELATAHAALSRFSRELEAKVDERTAEVRRQAAEIAGLAAEKDELLGIAAHDIRGPLTTILGFIEIARLSLKSGEADSLDKDLAVIEEAARNVGRLLSDLLDLKKIEAGKIRVEPADLDAGPFFETATALAALEARQRRIDFTVRIDEGLRIWADPKRLEQALGNLVANALKFTREGGSVTVEARPVEDGAEVSVLDTGPGIKPDELQRLFGAYVQGEAGRRAAGTGLGLAIAKKLIEIHGGRIWAESAENKGSRFAFVIPAARPAAGPPCPPPGDGARDGATTVS